MQADITAEEAAILSGGSPELMQLVRQLNEQAAANPAVRGPLSMGPLEALAAVSAIEGGDPSDDDKTLFGIFERLNWGHEQIERYLQARSNVGIE